MNYENSKTFYPQRLLFILSDKINLKKTDEYVALSNIKLCYTWENIKKLYKNNKFKISASTWNEKLSYLIDHILYHIVRIIFSISSKKHETMTNNRPITIYVSEM